jgi:hypothetical protein
MLIKIADLFYKQTDGFDVVFHQVPELLLGNRLGLPIQPSHCGTSCVPFFGLVFGTDAIDLTGMIQHFAAKSDTFFHT